MSYKDEKISKFTRLKQGIMIVEEYKIRFLELFRFASFRVAGEYQKCRKFQEGLRNNINVPVVALRYSDFGRLVDAAIRVEKTLTKERSWREMGQRRSQHDFQLPSRG